MKETKHTAEADALIESIRTQIQSRKGKALDDSVRGGDSAVLRRAATALDHLKGKEQSVRKWPRPLRFLRRNQQAVNDGLTDALGHLVTEEWRVREQLAGLEKKTTEFGERIAELAAQIGRITCKIEEMEEALRRMEIQLPAEKK